jgi:hypothetical protein
VDERQQQQQEQQQQQQQRALRHVLSLPHPVLVSLSGALTYLEQFGLAGVLRTCAAGGFRSLHGGINGAAGAGACMALDGSALRQLEVLVAGAQMAE